MSELNTRCLDAFPEWLKTLPEDAVALSLLLDDESLPEPARRRVAGSLNYLFKSLDLIPDGIEDLGFLDDAFVIRPGAMTGACGLDPKTLDVTIVVGGEGGPGAALKAAAMDRSLSGAAFTWTKTIVGGGSALMFTGTVQRPEPSSTEVRIVAMTCTVDLDAVQLPTHVILSGEFPEIPPPENYNIR